MPSLALLACRVANGLDVQVDHMPKKHEKLFAKSLSEEDFNSKIPEKVRCVFHFANKLDEQRKTYDWELFEDSQVMAKRGPEGQVLY